MDTKKPTLSPTRIGCFIQCPRKHRFQYLDKIPSRRGTELAFGECFHDALELNYAQKVTSRKDLPTEKVVKRFRDRFGEAMANETFQPFPGDDPLRLLEIGAAMVKQHHTHLAPMVMPLCVEKTFRVSLGADFPFDLTSRVDLIDEDGIIIDNKSYTKPPKQEYVDRDLQMSTYSLVYRLHFGECENGLRIDAVTKQPNPRIVQVYTRRTNEDAAWLLGQIEGVAKAILAGVDYPNNDSALCCPRWCGYWNRCKGVSHA